MGSCSLTLIGTHVPKAWGCEKILINGNHYCAKRLIVTPGWRCSLHRHLVKEECFCVEQGTGTIWGPLGPVRVAPGAVVEIPAGTWHCFWNDGDVDLVLLEISTHHDDADVERLTQSGPLHHALFMPQGHLPRSD